jgi:phage shock protein A
VKAGRAARDSKRRPLPRSPIIQGGRMGILSRFITVIQANLNALVSRTENPAKILEQTIVDLEAAYRKAKDQVAHAMADQKRMEQAVAKEQAEVKRWQDRAVLAVEKENDALAREALNRKNEHARTAIQLTAELEAQTANVVSLKDALKELQQKIADIKRQKGVLIAKQRRAEAQDQIYKTVEGIQGAGALETVQRMEDKIEHMTALADSRRDLAAEFRGDQLERRFKELGAGTPNVDAELVEMKQRLLLEHKGR